MKEQWVNFCLTEFMRLSSNQRYALKAVRSVPKTAETGLSLTRVHVCVTESGWCYNLKVDLKTRQVEFRTRPKTGPYKKASLGSIAPTDTDLIGSMLKRAITNIYAQLH